MSTFFFRKDDRWPQCADPTAAGAIRSTLSRHLRAAAILVALALALYVGAVIAGFYSASKVDGIIRAPDLLRDVAIDRDARGVPYVSASTLHDLFFADGFAQASDRLFQMEMSRRYAYGELSAIAGSKALAYDEEMRALGVAQTVARQWNNADPRTRAALTAFAQGVNAAERVQSLPVEFRVLLFTPRPWTPQDSLAVAVVAQYELGDAWRDVVRRDERFRALGDRCYERAYPLSDSRYDVGPGGERIGVLRSASPSCTLAAARGVQRPRVGSNAWAASAQRTHGGHALLANDPHVDLTIPGIWYAMELRAPGIHVAGATIPGIPGVVLGHNQSIAWGATNAEAATTVVYDGARVPGVRCAAERFEVRFSRPVYRTYCRSQTLFSRDAPGGHRLFIRWPGYEAPASPVQTILQLNAATSIAQALRTLQHYEGSPENFILADANGTIAFHMAGAIPSDLAWGRYIHPGTDASSPLALVPWNALPALAPRRTGVIVSANNWSGAALRLSAQFEPPYRAYRIAQLLGAKRSFGLDDFRAMQLDVYSPVEREIIDDVARLLPARALPLRSWDGTYRSNSIEATRVHEIVADLITSRGGLAPLLADLRERQPQREVIADAQAAVGAASYDARPWSSQGGVSVVHPLSFMFYGWLDGAPLRGSGDEYTIHLQEDGFAQGFRAVWDTGDWNRGGLTLPEGESGRPGSGHYTDEHGDWQTGRLAPLAFSSAAIRRASMHRLRLVP